MTPDRIANPFESDPTLDPRPSVRLFDGHTGQAAGWSAMVAAAAGADVVFIGESHGHDLGLAGAAALWDDILAKAPNATLSLEFFERDQQAALDDYLGGLTDEEGFRKAAGRKKGNYPFGHARMVERAKADGRPVVAANSPRRYTKLARTDGYDKLRSLTGAQRDLFMIPTRMPEGRYREDFMELMGSMMGDGSHSGEKMTQEQIDAKVEGIFRAQALWDATMSDSVANAMNSGGRPVVHVIGHFHTDFDGGTVQLLRHARPGVKIVTIAVIDEPGPTDEDTGRADFVWYVGETEKIPY